MTTTEKMFVQIFDRKRSIIEQLKQQRQRYDAYLASKLLIQGITPPNWLLNSEFHPPCSASELISGILLSNPAPNDTFAKTCASSNGSQGYKPSIIPSHHIDCTEDVATIVPPCHDNDTQDTLNYVPMSPEDQTDTISPNTSVKQEGSLAIIHRSRSRQKALQLRNSGKETAKSCLGKENNDDIPSGNKALGYDEAHDGIRESIDLSRPSILPIRISQEAELGGYSDKETGVYACSDFSSQSKGNEAQEVQTEDEEKMEKQSNVTVGRHTRSRSRCSKSITGEYESNRKSPETYVGRSTRSRSGKAQLPEIEDPLIQTITQSNSSQIQPIDGYQAIENSQVSSGRITNPRSSGANEATIENRKSRTKDEMSVMSKGNEAREVQTEYEEKMEKQSNVTVGRHKRSRSHCSKSITGDYESNRKSHETYVGRVTRSSSGKAQLPEIEGPLEKRVTQSYCSQIQPIDGIQAIENSQVNSARITKPISGGANEAKIENSKRGTNDEMSVKPKQLDFDEGAETCLADILTEGMGSLKENTKDKPAALPCTFSAERMSEKRKSLAFETQEALEIEVDPSLPKSDKISRHTSLLDRGPDSTEEHMIGINDGYSADPSLSVPNVNMLAELSSRKRMYETDEEQELYQEASYLSLPNTISEHTMSLHSDAEPALTSEKAWHSLSSCNDSDKISYVGLSNPDTKATMSLHRDAAGATLSPKQNSDVTRSEHPSEVLQSGNQERNAGLQTTSLFSNVEEVGCFELPEVRAGIDVLPEYNVNNALDGSWPCYKRRKIRYQVHSKSASPRVRVNTSLGINGNIQKESMDYEKEYSCISQKLIISQDSGGMFPNPDLVVNTSLGINGNIRNESMDGEKENSSCISQKLVISRDSDAMFSNPEFFATAAHGIKYLESEEPELTPKEQHEEGKISLGRSVMMSFTCEEKQLPSRVANLKQDIIGEPSNCFFEGEFKEAPTCAVQHSGVLYPDLEFTDVVGQGNCTQELTFTKTILDKYDAVESVPEFESFIIDGKRDSIHNAAYELLNGKIPFVSEIAECTKLPEPIHRPTSLSTPSSPFPTVYTPYYTPGVYRSVPNGLIEKIDLTRNLLSNDDVFQGKSYPNCGFPSRRPGYDFAKPVISPLGKGFEEIAFKSDSSAKQRSCNPEHICFPIQEDPETSEEDVNVSDIPDTEINGAYSNKRISPIREPLCNITVETSHKVERGSLESETTEISIVEKHKQDTKKSEMHQRCMRTREGKANQSLSIDANSIKKHSDSLSSRYSQPKLSGKSSLRSRGVSLSEKEPKRTNIVSNVKSFIPFVRQKQESSCVPVKKEVKVKALEAAEEAKRKEEKKENERKQKREALELKLARSKQEKLEQMELKKILEEVERKRKESEKVAKKRQREEEERKDRQRKKQHIEDARCQQKQAEQKIHARREQSRSENEDGKAHERKYSNVKVDRAPEKEHTIRNPVNELVGSDGRETDNAPPSTNDNKSCTGSSDTGKAGKADVTDISTPNCDKTDERIDQMREESYDISPYQRSDDEEEEDDIPNKKFIPTWASKSSVSVALSWMKDMDPDTIFSPGSFCSLEEVLLPRRLVQK